MFSPSFASFSLEELVHLTLLIGIVLIIKHVYGRIVNDVSYYKAGRQQKSFNKSKVPLIA